MTNRLKSLQVLGQLGNVSISSIILWTELNDSKLVGLGTNPYAVTRLLRTQISASAVSSRNFISGL